MVTGWCSRSQILSLDGQVDTCQRTESRNEMSTVPVHSATHLTGIAPQFLVDDLDRAIAYYRDRLGFDLDFVYQSFYASVTRDGFAIHLKHAPKLPAERAYRKQQEHLDAYVSVSGVRDLFGE